jgi:hypothetical protein
MAREAVSHNGGCVEDMEREYEYAPTNPKASELEEKDSKEENITLIW